MDKMEFLEGLGTLPLLPFLPMLGHFFMHTGASPALKSKPTKSADGSRPAQSAPGGTGAVSGTAADRSDLPRGEQGPLYARLSPDIAAGPVAQALQARDF